MASRLYNWLDSRLKLKPIQKTLLDEPIPGGASWIYVFGSATLFLFLTQALTGMFLAVYYAPTPDHAYDSVQFIEQELWFGGFVRGLHHWGASTMVIAIGLHMLQVFLYGAYKPPREMMWVMGVVLFLMQTLLAFRSLQWRGTGFDERPDRWLSNLAQAAEWFPLLGLIGTVAGILQTFSSIDGPTAPAEIIRLYAPAITATGSGLFMALLNILPSWIVMICRDLILSLGGGGAPTEVD